GTTSCADFPTTPDAFRTTKHGGSDAFVAELNETGSNLIYSTYLGGGGNSTGNAIVATPGVEGAFVTGSTQSANFPTTPNAVQSNAGGLTDAFVAVLRPFVGGAASLAYSTYLGGSGTDEGHGITEDT